MDSMFMDQIIDQIIDSWLEEESGLPNLSNHSIFEESSKERRYREQQEELDRVKSTCPRCGGPLYYGGCDCYWSPGPYGVGGEWTTGD